MKNATLLLCALSFACAVEHDGDVAFRGLELEASSGEPMCSDPTQLVPGDETKLYTVISAEVVELADGVEPTIDPKTGIMYLDEGLTGIQCRCDSGCAEALDCNQSGDGTTRTCNGGQCVGVSDDGQECGGCSWHTVDLPSPSPAGGSPGGLDPTGEPGDKPPGIDPTIGELDPTFGDDGLPPFDPTSGELDPTR